MKWKSRKVKRKEARRQRKARIDAYHRRKSIKQTLVQEQSSPLKQEKEVIQGREPEKEPSVDVPQPLSKGKQGRKGNVKSAKKERKKNILDFEARRRQNFLEDNEKEERHIRLLERKLRLNRRKDKTKLPMSFVADGLDYLLDVCESHDERAPMKDHPPAAKHDEDMDQCKGSDMEEAMIEDYDDASNEESDIESEGVVGNLLEEGESSDSDDNQHREVQTINDFGSNAGSRRGDKDSAVKENVIDRHLEKEIRALINRMSESNMTSIASKLEDFSQIHGRHSVSLLLMQLTLSSIIIDGTVPERLIMERALLVAILHAHIGSTLARILLDALLDVLTEATSSIRRKNAILLLSYLYNFKVVDKDFLWDYASSLLETFEEDDIDALLVILRCSGMTFREGDPLALKKLILQAQEKASSASPGNFRVKFMLEILTAIRSNNVKKIPDYDPLLLENGRKVLSRSIRSGAYNEPISRKQDVSEVQADESSPQKSTLDSSESHLLQLSRSQRLNTDIRRKIFSILVSAQDYLDAYEKLMHLGLRKNQKREIIHILVSTCIQEKPYNPYYAYLAEHLCSADRHFAVTLRFTLWDRIKELGNARKFQRKNLAGFMSQILLAGSLPLSVLKVVDFSQLTEVVKELLSQVMMHILKCDNEEVWRNVFLRISKGGRLQLLRASLRLFLKHFLLPEVDEESLQRKINVAIELLEVYFIDDEVWSIQSFNGGVNQDKRIMMLRTFLSLSLLAYASGSESSFSSVISFCEAWQLPEKCHCDEKLEGMISLQCSLPLSDSALVVSLPQKHIESLVHLQVIGTTFTTFNLSTFRVFKNLKSIAFIDDHLDEESPLQLPCTSDFPQLQSLILRNNTIRNIHLQCSMKNLEQLDLSYNLISHLPPSLIEELPALNSLNLKGNIWGCNSNLLWLVEIHSAKPGLLVDADSLECSHPYEYKPLLKSLKFILDAKRECPSDPPYGCECTVPRIIPLSNGTLMPLVYVNCSHRGLQQFPNKLPDYAVTLHMEHNLLTRFDGMKDIQNFTQLVNLYMDYNQIEEVEHLEGTSFAENFRLLSLKGNRLKQIQTHVLRSILLHNINAHSLYLSENPWQCDCIFTPDFQFFIADFQKVLHDKLAIRCDLSKTDPNAGKQIARLPLEEICEPGWEIHYLDILNGVMAFLIIIILIKVTYDWYFYRKMNRIPWLAKRMP
ncbi:unnamed protein product [Darwinula stevensoni]|uniref:MI domain-containing protein n=1 Tax=Darwinula stevensoni TaxID=69355 RepID=A0A7R8X8R2_9CRUS|nr:unnamed protein product [Darwinula stevensoni]CAG0883733.1 unnamed protein product [Darwinula stevensoni]